MYIYSTQPDARAGNRPERRVARQRQDSWQRFGARKQRGATAVEMAIVLPIFGLLMAGFVEFSHAYMVQTTLTAAAKQGARFGSMSDVTNANVNTKIQELLGNAYNTSNVTVLIKDAQIYDDPDADHENINHADLDDIELSSISIRGQLFLVQVSIPYADVALFAPIWTDGITLSAVGVMRHE